MEFRFVRNEETVLSKSLMNLENPSSTFPDELLVLVDEYLPYETVFPNHENSKSK